MPYTEIARALCVRALTRSLTVALAAWASSSSAFAACPAAPWTLGELEALRDADPATWEPARVESAASAVLPCLADRRPEVRDELAFTALSKWLRAGQVRPEALATLRTALVATLDGPDDRQGFARPFAALALSEVARTDRVSSWMSAEEREDVVRAASAYLVGIEDHRGFDERHGWRHGVAHGADLAMQLVLDPNVDDPQVARLLEAVRSQVAPTDGTAYVYGEAERLARPVLFAVARGALDEEAWRAFFGPLVSPAPFASWEETFRSDAGLAKRHDTAAFLTTLVATAATSEDPALQAWAPLVLEAARAVP